MKRKSVYIEIMIESDEAWADLTDYFLRSMVERKIRILAWETGVEDVTDITGENQLDLVDFIGGQK